jgi:glutaredoxin
MTTIARTPAIASNQSCSVAGLYRTWLAYAAGLIVFAATSNPIGFATWLVAVPAWKLIQFRFWNRLSPLFGYGAIADERPAQRLQAAPGTVTFYHALGCPFCPIVLERLSTLRREMGFTLTAVDVTLHPQRLTGHGIRSVPVVEAGGRFLVGNATSKELAELISSMPSRKRADA